MAASVTKITNHKTGKCPLAANKPAAINKLSPGNSNPNSKPVSAKTTKATAIKPPPCNIVWASSIDFILQQGDRLRFKSYGQSVIIAKTNWENVMSVDLDVPIKLENRKVLGKGLQVIRQNGQIPAVVYNHGQPSLHVMAPEKDLVELYAEAGKHHPLNLEVGQQKFLALIKDVHYHPVRRQIQHVVFQAI